MDYFSKYIDSIELRSEATTAVIGAMKTVFACNRHQGILRSEYEQFSSAVFRKFCSDHGMNTNEVVLIYKARIVRLRERYTP